MQTQIKAPFIFDKDLIKIGVHPKDWEDLLQKVGDVLYEKGYVKNTFTKALIHREKEYPTGMNIGNFGIAIPHTDAVYVEDTTLAVITLKESISFELMAEEGCVDVRVVFVLVVKDPKVQVFFLRKLMMLFQKIEVLKKIEKAKDKETILKVLKEELY